MQPPCLQRGRFQSRPAAQSAAGGPESATRAESDVFEISILREERAANYVSRLEAGFLTICRCCVEETVTVVATQHFGSIYRIPQLSLQHSESVWSSALTHHHPHPKNPPLPAVLCPHASRSSSSTPSAHFGSIGAGVSGRRLGGGGLRAEARAMAARRPAGVSAARSRTKPTFLPLYLPPPHPPHPFPAPSIPPSFSRPPAL